MTSPVTPEMLAAWLWHNLPHTPETAELDDYLPAARLLHADLASRIAAARHEQRDRDLAAALADAVEARKSLADAERELAEYRTAHVCTIDCKPNKHVAFAGRRALDDAHASIAARDQEIAALVTTPDDEQEWETVDDAGVPTVELVPVVGHDRVRALLEQARAARIPSRAGEPLTSSPGNI